MANPKTEQAREGVDAPEPETVEAEILEEAEGADEAQGAAAGDGPSGEVAAADSEDAAGDSAEGRAEGEAEQVDPLAQAQAQVKEWQDKYLRLHAEWDTYRRRMKEQREEERVRATEKLVEGLIPVMDDFERTIDYAQKNGETGLLGGVEAVHTKLADTLTREGVCIIDPAGEAYNALEAQAVGTVDDPSVPDETVAQVYQRGYRMGTKVLRPAMVTITTGGPKRPSEEEQETQE